ncbi:MAG: hypothetical protein U1E65_04310 [Myxococcota bacterium]
MVDPLSPRTVPSSPWSPAISGGSAEDVPTKPQRPASGDSFVRGGYATGLDLSATPADLAETGATAMSDAQMLKLAETPAGASALKGMAKTMQQGGSVSPERQAQIDRIQNATFTPSGGIKLEGSEADKQAYTRNVRKRMMESPSFAKLMHETNADKAHPVNLKLERGTGTKLDSFRRQTVDLDDLEKLPEKPSADRPEAITQGAVLAHMMREQREKALDPNKENFDPAHKAAIESENAYRRDIGQQSMRKLPPEDETRVDTGFGSFISIHFDDGHDEALVFNDQGNLNGSASYVPTF